jgi:hypothetical protein
MIGQPGLFGVGGRLRELSAKGDDLERIGSLVDFEVSGLFWREGCRARTAPKAAGMPSIAC